MIKKAGSKKYAITFDDVILKPQYSTIASRASISLETRLTKNYKLALPYIASPMDTVCGERMASTLINLGATGCVHRFMSIDDQCAIVRNLVELNRIRTIVLDFTSGHSYIVPVVAAVGVGESEKKRAISLLRAGVNILLIDVAHGHHLNVKNMIEYLRGWADPGRFDFDIIAGSVATPEAAGDLCKWGADAVRVGIGGGSVCSTRIQTGHGVPSLTAILECSEVAGSYGVPVIADGGIRNPGDIAKALAFGAETVMLGSMIAGTKETPEPYMEANDGTLWKEYRGAASSATKKAHGMPDKNIEGESTRIRDKGSVKYIIKKLNDGVQSAFSYSGANNIEEFHERVEYYNVTSAGQVEAKPHLIEK